MSKYKHSVYLDVNKCNGCTTCLRHCPTEAIRIKDKHAVINEDRCIDCGECIRVCPQKAKKVKCSGLEEMDKFKYKIALPAPSLYGQFENLEDVDYVLNGLLKIGFDDIVEVSSAAELVSAYTRNYLKKEGVKKPLISSACPVIMRLIGLRFPSLSENIIHMLPPMEVAASMAREKAKKEHPEFKDEDVGVFFISPCPAKASYVNNGFADYKSKIDAVISISDIYFLLINKMDRTVNVSSLSNSGVIGIGWATSGGEATAVLNERYLAADGIDNVINILDQIENENITDLDFVELNACTGGCVGGVLTVQNPFVAKARLRALKRYLPVSQNFLPPDKKNEIAPEVTFEKLPDYEPISKLSANMSESLEMMRKIAQLKSTLPNIDCGSCGAPNCRAFAEDVVKKCADVGECPLLKLKNLG